MKGYSKININNSCDTQNWRSPDFSDDLQTSSFPQRRNSSSSESKLDQNQIDGADKGKQQQQGSDFRSPAKKTEEEEEEVFRNSNAVLRRNCSVSSAAAYGMQSAVKRVWSMRRSSSVSERYCRIHDQSVTLTASPICDDEDEATITRSATAITTKNNIKAKKSGSAKILKACKRFFGL